MQSRLPILLGLLALMIIGTVLRAAPVTSAPLWFDEADTWRSGIIDPATSHWSPQTGLYEGVPMEYRKFFLWQNHFETAPLTFLLSRISCDILGSTSEWAMRLPSLLAGILCIPAAFWLGRVVRDDLLGLVTAALVTFDPNQVDQSHQCRMYAILMLLMLLAIGLTIKLIREPEPGLAAAGTAAARRSVIPAWQWILLGTLFGLLLCTTQFTLALWLGITLGGAGLLVLGYFTGQPHPKTKQVAIGLTTAYLVGLAVANIGVYRIIDRIINGGSGDRPNLSYGEMTREIVVVAKDLINLTPAGLIIYVIAGAGFVLLFKKCKTSTAILVGVAVANILMLFKFLRIHHFMDGRYLSCIQPAVFIGLAFFAVGFQRLMLRRAALAIIILFIAVQAWQSTHLSRYYQQPDRYLFTAAIMETRDTLKPGETALIYPGVACILGQYYHCPLDPALFNGFWKFEDHMVQEQQKVPADLKASAVRVVMGMFNHETADFKQKRQRTAVLELIAKHYGVTIDEKELEKHLQQRRILTATISKDGVKMSSVGVE